MSDRVLEKEKGEPQRKRNWRAKYRGNAKDKETALPSPQEGLQLSYDHPLSGASSASSSTVTLPGTGLPFRRSNSGQSISSLVSSKPINPLLSRRWSTSSGSQQVLTEQSGDSQNLLERTQSHQLSKNSDRPTTGSFSKMSLSSMMGGLSGLSLSRGGGDDKERGRSEKNDKEKDKRSARSSSFSGTQDDRDSSVGRARSQSPFRIRRRRRDVSPQIEALTQSDAESDAEGPRIRPRNAFSVSNVSDDEYGDESQDEEDESDEEEWSDGDHFDSITESNTTRNALIPSDLIEQHDVLEVDPLGEGVNVVVPPEPYFPSTLNNTGGRNPRRRRSLRPQEVLPLDTSRPVFQRDRCTITLTHGDPQQTVDETGRRPKRYVLASDLSVESRYALEWGVGTVLRDGDEM